MCRTNERVDAYIADAPAFAQPILEKIRTAFHKADSRIVEEIKWGVPHFCHNGIVGGMAAFKNHASFGFWKGKQMTDPEGILQGEGGSMCGVKVAKASELPTQKVLIAYIKEAVKLNDDGVKGTPAGPTRKKKPIKTTPPADLKAALATNRKAKATFEGFPPGAKRDYIVWITEAKREDTRQRRLKQAIEWMAEGKKKNWKYEKC